MPDKNSLGSREGRTRSGINQASFGIDKPTRGSLCFCCFSCKHLDQGRGSSECKAKIAKSTLVSRKLLRIV